MLLPNSNGDLDPRKESFLTMFRLNLCPSISFPSFTSIMIFVNITTYIITILLSGIKKGDQFLVPYDHPIINLVFVSPYSIKYDLQIWRIFTGLFFYKSILILLISTTIMAIIGTILKNPISFMHLVIFKL